MPPPAERLLYPICVAAVEQDANPNFVAKKKDANTWLDIATLLLRWFYDHNTNPTFRGASPTQIVQLFQLSAATA